MICVNHLPQMRIDRFSNLALPAAGLPAAPASTTSCALPIVPTARQRVSAAHLQDSPRCQAAPSGAVRRTRPEL